MLNFSKYHGTGNDFVMINNLDGDISLSVAKIKHFCDRRFGIGADGVILIEQSEEADFRMNYYNSDGSQSFCGNGSRCAVHFAQTLGILKEHVTFEAIDGLHEAKYADSIVHIHMGNTPLPVAEGENYFLHTGSPHVVSYRSDLNELLVVDEGRKIRCNDRWKAEGTNVNFVLREADYLKVRTYERGVEGETLSCGTGVTAVALIDAFLHGGTSRKIHTMGGQLNVSFEQTELGFKSVWMSGPAAFVFSGKMNVDE